MYQADPLNIVTKTGFIAVEPKPSDFIAGAESGIIEQSRITDSNWHPFLTAGKLQKFFWTSNGAVVSFETDACVSFSAIDAMEAYMNWMTSNNGFSVDNVNWLKQNGYFDANGRVSLSPRFTAKMSGTTTDGNTLPAVANSLRHDGCVPAALWDAPLAALQALNVNSPTFATDCWNIYYAAIPASTIALGVAFAARFDVMYEWIAYPAAPLTTSQFLAKLTVAPLQIATAVCPPWNTDQVIQACGTGTAHATLMDFIESNGDFDIRDHYVPFDKRFAPDYTIAYAMRIVVGETTPPIPPPPFTHDFLVDLTFGTTSSEVTALQKALQINGVFPLNVVPTGFYGSLTALAVLKFRTKYKISSVSDVSGHTCGPLTRQQLNVLFNH